MPALMPEKEDDENILLRLIKQLRGNQSPEELGAEISGSARQQALKGVMGAGEGFIDKTKEIMNRPPSIPENEAGTQLQQLLMGRAQTHAKPLIPPGWHAPMALPNQPRDISKPKEQEAPSRFKASDLGQDPRAVPLPDEDQMSKVNGALRLPPIAAPEKASYKDLGSMANGLDDPKGLIPANMSREEFTAEHPNPTSYTPTPGDPNIPDEEDDEQPMALMRPMGNMAEDNGLPPDPRFPQVGPQTPMANEQPIGLPADDPRERLKAYLARQEPMKVSDPRDALLGDTIRGNDEANNRLGLYKLLFRAANQAGSVGDGKIASSAAFDDYASGAQQQNQRSSELFSKRREIEKKAQDDKLKGMMFLAKQKQDEEKYGQDLGFRRDQLKETARTNDNMANYRNDMLAATQGNTQDQQQYRQDMLDLKRNPVAAPMNDLQKAQAALARANAARTAQKPAKDNKVSSAAATLDSYRKTLERANDDYEKILKANPGYDPTNLKDKVSGSLGALGNTFKSNVGQLAEQAQIEWYRTKLRKESGATIGAKEALDEASNYFPRYGDTQATIKAKSAARRAIVEDWKENYNAQVGIPGAAKSSHGTQSGVASDAPEPGMKWQRNKKTGAMRQVPIDQ